MASTANEFDHEDQASLNSVRSVDPTPDTLTKLVRRLRTLTLTLLPLQVPLDSINDPTSRIITPRVVQAYIAAGGDLVEALPYCLLRARKEFIWEANHNPADYDENLCRAIACEVLARRVIHVSPPERITSMMSTRYTHKELDGDNSDKTSALEMAIDSHCTIFLSSSEAQDVVNDLWQGRIVQKHSEGHVIEFQPYREAYNGGFWAHFDPARLSVPRYQNMFRIIIWFFFLFVYSQAVREPLDKVNKEHRDLDPFEVILYVMGLSFAIEDFYKIYKLLLFVSWRALAFWNFVSILTDVILVVAFSLRMAGLSAHGDNFEGKKSNANYDEYRMKLITIFDGYKYVGTMQICVARMLQESGIFFALLALLGIGFLQGLYALDAADGNTEPAQEVINLLIQALLQSPDYGRWNGWAPALFLYYLWNVATVVILLNILISLFSSAYDDVVEDAAAEYLAYFADKTIGMIRAPDEFAYPAPFNLIELVMIAPFEYVLSKSAYAKFNRFVMPVLFFLPLTTIAIFEAELTPSKNKWVKDWLAHPDQGLEDLPEHRDPIVEGEDANKGWEISKVKFDDLVKMLPDTTHSSETVILREIRGLKSEIAELKKLLLEKHKSE
ncbi:calcium activated cation channel [Irpex rosettiformis]|uniref:Calcium activated cation channel n=1 Tax=Irpex rosettiformis TaxID=378272 RepID=A0ACB8U470_9APHY|nr:calcium activated cation channel [Irpex rosettiformis]